MNVTTKYNELPLMDALTVLGDEKNRDQFCDQSILDLVKVSKVLLNLIGGHNRGCVINSDNLLNENYVVVCAWCDASKYVTNTMIDNGVEVSHGMCERCSVAMQTKLNECPLA